MSESIKTVKEFAPEDRPQEKAERLGINSLTLPELWAVILRSGQPGVPITTLTRELMRQNEGCLRNLERRDRRELMLINGIGRVKALQIEAVLEIMRRYNRETIGEKVKIKSSQDIFSLMKDEARSLDYEKIWIIHLSRSNSVLGYREVSRGGTTGTVFDLKMVLKDSLLTSGCESVIMCHNHPSRNPKPSPQDDQITRSLSEGCRFLGLKLLDHLILAGDEYYSYADCGRL